MTSAPQAVKEQYADLLEAAAAAETADAMSSFTASKIITAATSSGQMSRIKSSYFEFSFKSNAHEYSFDCIYGSAILTSTKTSITWKTKYSKDKHTERFKHRLIDPVWGVSSGNAGVFIVRPFKNTSGEKRKRVFTKLDTTGESNIYVLICFIYMCADILSVSGMHFILNS